MYDVLHSPLVKIVGANACPTVTATPETVKAAFTKENDVFAEHNVKYLDPILNFADKKLFAYQMLQAWQPILGLSEEENDRAVEVGYQCLKDYETSIRNRARQVLDQLEREDRIGIVMLGRPYHHDPGLNHEIMDEFQKLGYPIFSQNTLPLDEDLLERLFGEEVRVSDVQWAADHPGAHFFAKQPLQQVFIKRQSILREDGIAELLEFIHDFVIEARIVVVGPSQHHDANAVLALELIEHLPRTVADAGFVILQALVAYFNCSIVLFFGQSQNRLPGLQHLVCEKLLVGEVQDRVKILHIVLGENVVLFRERGLHRFRGRSHRWAGIRSDDLHQR